MLKNPIGVFDSGIGGLTVFKEIVRLLPDEDVVYFGDTARMPYGGKSMEIVELYTKQGIAFLKSCGAKLIVTACGTVSTVLLKNRIYFDEEESQVELLGIVEPSCRAAVAKAWNGKIGVIGTTVAIESGKYEDVIGSINPNIEVFKAACPLLAPLIESRFSDENDETFYRVSASYIEPLLKHGISVLILGCTHYPIIKNIISEIAPNLVLIDSGFETAFALQQKILDSGYISKTSHGNYEFFVSDIPEHFIKNSELFLGTKINGKVRRVDVTKVLEYDFKKF
ncbi:MAG: glutamate racemase [Oscillospiraceae bacterium]|nr:glutamate racemase [Oscillospiraceae bacterium]